MVATSNETLTTASPSPAAAYEVIAGPPAGIRTWMTQPHQFSGTNRPDSCGRWKTRATEVGEPGLTSRVQASNSSWQTVSQCVSTSVPNQPFSVMHSASGSRRAGRLAVRLQSG
jgi:hypothetical protein